MDTMSTRSAQSPSEPTSLSSSPAAVETEGIASSPKKPTTKPGLVLRVGVSGHRDLPATEVDRLEEQARAVLQRIASVAGDIFKKRNDSGLKVYSDLSDQSLVLRVISPLAEGADRIVADQGTQIGFELQCPLPFPQEEYEEDFKEKDKHPLDTREDFQKLLVKAKGAILELDGKRSAEDEAYEAVGRFVLRQCDVLIAVWDPKRDEKTGGTRQIVRESLGLEIPTVWISASANQAPCILLSADPISTDTLDRLEERLKNLFLFNINTSAHAYCDEDPKERKKKEDDRRQQEITAASSFFKELPPEEDSGFFYRWFRDFWCWKPFKKKTKRPPIEPDWRPLFESNPKLRDQIHKNYDWADCLAKHYGGLYRSSFVMTYCMGALAVLIAFLGFFFEEENSLWHYAYFAELLLIVVILVITLQGRNKGWHRRWMDYRLLAENLRQVQFLAPLGRITLALKVPAHLQPSDPRASWPNWYFRALVRDGGMIPAKFEPSYLQSCRQVLLDSIQKQIHYHCDNHETLETLSSRLRRTAQILFCLAVVACALHAFHLVPPGAISFVVNLATIVLPVFSGALAAISHHGEFERLALRSEALSERLTNLKEELSQQTLSTSNDLGRAAQTFSEIMFGELLDWKFAFLDKNLDLPA